MTMQAAQLIGARVIGGDGQVVGTIQEIFNDDKDGTPVWARIRAGTRELFVPLRGSRVTKDGLSLPFDSRQIMSSPDVGVKQHMSAAQTDQLKRHFGLTVPTQGGPPDADPERGQAQRGEAQREQAQREQAQREQAQRDQAQRGEAQRGEAQREQAQREQAQREQAQRDQAQRGEAQREQAQREQAQRDQAQRDQAQRDQAQREQAQRGQDKGGRRLRDEAQTGELRRDEAQAGEDWLIRTEERFDVGTEMRESGRARLRKYVDVEPVEQTVHVFHEEYEIERVPISAEEQVRGEIAEGEQEIALHEERPVLHKEAVAVERVRLKVKRVDEDRTLRDEVRRERLEVENGDSGERTTRPAGSARPNQIRR
jgi:uncharacterized protein (TIGR02271 family)